MQEVQPIQKIKEVHISEKSQKKGTTSAHFFDKDDDNKLCALKMICLEYLDGSKIEHMDNTSLLGAHGFLNSKLNELISLNKTFGVPRYSYPFLAIEQTMAHFTMNGSLNNATNETIKSQLYKEINQVIDQVSLTLGVVQKIMQERNMFNADNSKR